MLVRGQYQRPYGTKKWLQNYRRGLAWTYLDAINKLSIAASAPNRELVLNASSNMDKQEHKQRLLDEEGIVVFDGENGEREEQLDSSYREWNA